MIMIQARSKYMNLAPILMAKVYKFVSRTDLGVERKKRYVEQYPYILFNTISMLSF